MTNKRHTVLYTGCTSDIVKRVTQHKNHYFKGSFSDKYNCEYCVYFEEFPYITSAIKREKPALWAELTKQTMAEIIAATAGE